MQGVLHGVNPGRRALIAGKEPLRSGEYWATQSGDLALANEPAGARVTVLNATSQVIRVSGRSLSGLSRRGLSFAGRSRLKLNPGQEGKFLATEAGWLAVGLDTEFPVDPLAGSLELALPFDQGLVDLSPEIRGAGTPKVVTAGGSPIISTAQSKFYERSLALNGVDQSLSISGHSPPGTGDCCYEGWFFAPTVKSGAHLINTGGGAASFLLYFPYSAGLAIYSQEANQIMSNAVVAATWQHFALWRLEGVWRLAVDGVIAGSWEANFDMVSSSFSIGNNTSPAESFAFAGFLQDFRYYRAAKYGTANFARPGSVL